MSNIECDVCCSAINKSINSQVKCPNSSCEFVMCKKCVRYYLMNSMDLPHCMSCKAQWGRLFTIQNLNKVFWDGDYMTHRKEILTEREISKIPETMEYAEQVKQLDTLAIKKREIMRQKAELQKAMRVLQDEIWKIDRESWEIKNGNTAGKERKKFIMSCQNPDCNGFLSTQYKCEICNYSTCSKCLEFIGDDKDNHECKDDNLKTAEEIRTTTKPCPNCSQRIYKISGCDQMWCVDCKVSFSWNTGQLILSGVIHNPHYYEYLQTVNGGQANRNPQDVQCGGLVQIYLLTKMFNSIDSGRQYKLSKLHQVISDITYDKIVRLREKIRETENMMDLRASYILKKINKQELTTRILNNDKIYQKSQEELHVYELLSVYGIEFFRSIHDMRTDFVLSDEIEAFRNLITYCNEQFKVIGATYNAISIQLCPESYKYYTVKYTISSLKNGK